MPDTAEHQRLQANADRQANWQRWGPYLAERQWATVREDYSPNGDPWGYFPHDHARSRAYRWGEDGLLGWTDRQCRLCFALALWNGKDDILKERLFGLTGPEGNHAEDCKELYYYQDATPTNSYAKASYIYPQAEYPYDDLVATNGSRTKKDPEYELADTGVLDEDRFFEVTAEYAKASPNDTLIRVTVHNAGPDAAELHVLPTLWYRNTWVWGCAHDGCTLKPQLRLQDDGSIRGEHETLGVSHFWLDKTADGNAPPLLWTDNETNHNRFDDGLPCCKFTKDAFHRQVIDGETKAVNPQPYGTKVAGRYTLKLAAGQSVTLRARLALDNEKPEQPFGEGFDTIFQQRLDEADAFYDATIDPEHNDDERDVARQAYAGLLWTKQFYHYVVEDWVKGDPHQPDPPESRKEGRNRDWDHVFARDVLSMPDKWEYPWFAAWDSAFHMIPMARIDPHWAKKQLLLFLREWYLHPNGQIPAYEFAFNDVNPPVHAWACWRVYKMTGPRGQRDRRFLASCFQKLLLNFTWWVNRKDPTGQNVFAGGFLGLDNIGVFDRSQPLPEGQTLAQSDGTAWMAFYSLTMLAIAIELAQEWPEYEDMASKFFEHFIAIADAIHTMGDRNRGLWHGGDGFYYDHLSANGQTKAIRLRSLVGLMPLIAVEIFKQPRIDKLPGFKKRMEWFLKYRPDLAERVSFMQSDHRVDHDRMLLAVPSKDKVRAVLRYMLDESEFLCPFGIRSMSRVYADEPYRFQFHGHDHTVAYQPGESDSLLFGGNSNWRGPVWFPINYLLVEALQRYHHFYGDTFTVEYPTGSGQHHTLQHVANDLRRRLASLFLKQPDGTRPCLGTPGPVLFHEYFHGDTGRGLGASHQTGWTALVTRCL
ncbi:MAG: glucosidase [Planctomycetota bacterium]